MDTASKPRLAQLVGAHKHYGKVQALRGVDLELRGGELLALLGPNGAGKTTAIALLLGLLRPDRGNATLFGRDPQDIVARRNIGVMLQDASLPPTLEVGELLRLTASYYPQPREVADSAGMAGVADLLQRRYATLSGGQQRRVQFALALCGNPRLLFLDEPTVGMDIEARQKLWAAIRKLVAEGCGVVLTTHYLEEAEALADRVCVMAHGRDVEHRTAAHALQRHPRAQRIHAALADDAAVGRWPEVVEARLDGGRLWMSTRQAEALLRRLLDADAGLADLEVQAAGLAEAFTELTHAADADAGREAELEAA